MPPGALPSLDDLNYQVQRFIETDSKMSDVLLATDRRGRQVVLKIARVDQRARAHVNRQAINNTVTWLSQLGSYRGLARLYPVERKGEDWWRRLQGRLRGQSTYCATLATWPGQPEFVVMEYAPGGSLRDFVGGHRLDIKLALYIAYEVARSLAYTHRHGCVHRDIKPENILFRTLPTATTDFGRSRPVLIDFGVAARVGEPKLVSGSRLWMAPELQEAYERHPLPVDPAWDVFALGLILCYMITGRRPRRKNYDYASYEFFRDRTFAVLDREIEENTEAQKTVKVQLKQLIARTLDQQAANRPSAAEFAAEAVTLLTQLGAPLSPGEQILMRLEDSNPLPIRRQLWLGVAGVVILAVLLGSLVGSALWRTLPAAEAQQDDPPATVQAVNSEQATPTVLAQSGEVETSTQAVVESVGSVHTTTFTQGLAATEIAPAPTQESLSLTLPPPTLIPQAPTVPSPPPTLIALPATATEPAPTLVPSAPTATPERPTPTVTPTTVPPTPTRTVQPTRTPGSTLTPRPTVAASVGRVQLLAPESGVHSDQSKVEFAWQSLDQPLAADQCFELVFWDANRPTDKRSPVGASKALSGRVDFALLATSGDSLLSRLAQSSQEISWGVRIVSCVASGTILRDVQEVRVYTYEGQSTTND